METLCINIIPTVNLVFIYHTQPCDRLESAGNVLDLPHLGPMTAGIGSSPTLLSLRVNFLVLHLLLQELFQEME